MVATFGITRAGVSIHPNAAVRLIAWTSKVSKPRVNQAAQTSLHRIIRTSQHWPHVRMPCSASLCAMTRLSLSAFPKMAHALPGMQQSVIHWSKQGQQESVKQTAQASVC